MESQRLHSYNAAIKALNGLQTNAAVLEKIKSERLKKYVNQNLAETKKYLAQMSISSQDLNDLPVIHVSGTKGKGSTCAFAESILRHHGLKTGFYSSPHLVSATERIRINGQPLSQKAFADYFWRVYSQIASSDPKPSYFKFLTIMAYHVFIEEKVDVALVEVGIGGAYDCTNVLEKPVAVGITLLDYDHTKVLGNTIEEIAWHKAGIMKAGSIAFANPSQPEAALKVLYQRSKEIGASLFLAPPIEDYDWGRFPKDLGLYRDVHGYNASLALQLARYFLTRTLPNQASGFALKWPEALGLRLCFWPGRSQVVKRNESETYFLDGAHTEQSMWACRNWFDHIQVKSSASKPYKILLFNSTGDRDPEILLAPLANFKFDLAIFCTNETKHEDLSADNTNLNFSFGYALRKCEANQVIKTKRLRDEDCNSVARPLLGVL